MKAASFEYHAPRALEEAASLLHEFGDDAKPLAGGQSLVPLLALRLTRFGHLVDLNGVEALRGITSGDGAVRIGAMTRQAEAEHDESLARNVPLLVMALPHIGHFQIRNRGTIGGSVAHGDPASELPAVACALRADIELTSTRGTRSVPARTFFRSTWETACEPDELVSAVVFPIRAGRAGGAVEELAWRRGDFAIAGAICEVVLDDGRIQQAGIALMGMASTPLSAEAAERALVGAEVTSVDTNEVARLAVEASSPPSDVHASATYRRGVATTLVAAAITRALEEARRG